MTQFSKLSQGGYFGCRLILFVGRSQKLCTGDVLTAGSDQRFDKPPGWRDNCDDTGIVMDLGSGDILWDGLSKPPSPRQLEDGRHIVCDSATGRLLVRQEPGNVKEIHFGKWFLHGLAVGARHIHVGMSYPRTAQPSFPKNARAKLAILDLRTLAKLSAIEFPFREVYDVQVLPDKQF